MSRDHRYLAALAFVLAPLSGCATGGIDSRAHAATPIGGDAGTWPGDAGWVLFGDTGPTPATPDTGTTAPPPAPTVLPGVPPLRCGRTYDQETLYLLRDGAPSYESLRHRDGTSLPAEEGGASCGSSCTENVTRLCDGDTLTGVLEHAATFSVQGAMTDAPGTGSLVITIGSDTLAPMSYATSSTSLPGFVNNPQPAAPVPSPERTEVTVQAVGGCVYFRAVTVTCVAGLPNTP